jgi:hypothetical protein
MASELAALELGHIFRASDQSLIFLSFLGWQHSTRYRVCRLEIATR